MTRTRPVVLAAIAAAFACASPPEAPDLASGRGFTLVNLHPDDERSRLFAVNYQQAGFIPLCSEVEYLGFEDAETFKFRVVSSSRDYEYIYHGAAAEPFADHLRRFFGPGCPRAQLEALSELDRKGVENGRASEGMSRRAVLLALGPPPRHVNPDPGAPILTYWKNRLDRFQIQFGPDDRVTDIRD